MRVSADAVARRIGSFRKTLHVRVIAPRMHFMASNSVARVCGSSLALRFGLSSLRAGILANPETSGRGRALAGQIHVRARTPHVAVLAIVGSSEVGVSLVAMLVRVIAAYDGGTCLLVRRETVPFARVSSLGRPKISVSRDGRAAEALEVRLTRGEKPRVRRLLDD